MKISIYFDEDSMDRNLVTALRARGANVLTALEADMVEQPDEKHIEYATKKGLVLFSFNVSDFYRIHTEYLRKGKKHAGIILARQQQFSVGERMRRLLGLIATKPAEEMINNVEFLRDVN